MRCNDLQDQINAFAAGDLAPVPAWRLRRHLEQCPVCAGRLYRARTLDLNLADLGAAAPSDLLRQRVFGDIEFLASRAAEEETLWHDRETRRRRKRAYAFAGALAAIAFTGAIGVPIAQLLWPRPAEITYKDARGVTWHLSGTYMGFVRLTDAQGMAIGSPSLYTLGDDPGGVLYIDVYGEHFRVEGYGNHLLNDAQGNLVCSVTLDSGGITHFPMPAWNRSQTAKRVQKPIQKTPVQKQKLPQATQPTGHAGRP